jgi:hypothetical protein
MRRIVLIGGAVASVLALACSDSAPTRTSSKSTDWSGAVITVAAQNPNARGELRGVVLDSAAATDPQVPIPGATVELYLEVIVPPANPGDTASMTVTKIGAVVTDANGRFLVTAIAEGDYYLVATPPDATHYSNATWAFASSGSNSSDATIYLPRRAQAPDSTSTPPPGPPPGPPIDSM